VKNIVSISATGKIRISTLCFSLLLVSTLQAYGAPTQQHSEQTVPSVKNGPPGFSFSTSQPSSRFLSARVEKKKAPKESEKETKVGPPPAKVPPKKKLIHRPQSTPPPGFVKLVPWENLTSHRPLPLSK
jgi:hypothetical protein